MLAVLGAGLVQGCGLALVALSFTLVHRANRVVNFTVGSAVVFGGYFTWWFVDVRGGDVWLALPSAVAIGGVFGCLVSLMLRGAVARAGMLPQVMVLVGLASVLTSVMDGAFGSVARNVPSPVHDTRLVPGLELTRLDVFIIGSVVALLVVTFLVLYGTRLGADFRATASNPVGAQLIGVSPNRVALVAWGAGMSMAVFAGWLYLPKFLVTATVGEHYLFQAFAAAVVGGFGSLIGSVLGGVVLGVASVFAAHTISAAFGPVVPLVVTMIVLTARPSGLLGERA